MSEAGRAREAGFTMLELLVVVAITGLIAGIAFPDLTRMLSRQRAEEARLAVPLALVRARAAALRGDRAVTVVWSPPARAIMSDAGPPVALPAGAVVAWPARGIIFHADGGATGGEVRVAIAAARPVYVAVDDATGRIRVSR